jgi:hypothetical protein
MSDHVSARAFKFQTARYAFVFSRHDAPEFCVNLTLLRNRGRRESRMPIAPAVVRTKSARVDPRFNRITPAFPVRMVYGLLRALPGDRLVCHRRLCGLTIHLEPGWAGWISARLDASIGAPGPHDFAVRDRPRQRSCRTSCRPASSGKDGLQRRSSARRPIAHGKSRPAIPLRARRCRVHRIPPRVRDVSRSAPHPGGTGRACNGDLPDVLSGIFLSAGLDRFLLICPSGCFSVVVCEAGKVLCRLAMLHLQFSQSALPAPTGPTALV